MAEAGISNAVLPLLIMIVAYGTSEEPFCGNKCHEKGLSTSRNCYCDKACAIVYNDCCGDFEHSLTKYGQISNRRQQMACRNLGKNVLVVNTCLPQWEGPDFIRVSCETSGSIPNEHDPMSTIPVTSAATGITYNNYYCAICNGDSGDVTVWKVRLVCPTLEDSFLTVASEALANLYFNRPTQQWGIVTQDEVTKAQSFHSCDIKPEAQEEILPNIRSCDPEEIHSCSPKWKRDSIRQMCGKYSDPVYADDKRYKNFYCAVCNMVDYSHISCGPALGPRHEGPPQAEGANFALLLDLNFASGNIVGMQTETIKCGGGSVFDPFKKICRNIVCGVPGYMLVNGKCEAIAR